MMHADPQEAMRLVRDHLRETSGRAYDAQLVGYVLQYLNICVPTAEEGERLIVIVPAKGLAPGQVVAEDVFDPYGRFLLRAGTTVTTANIARLAYLLGNQNVKVFAQSEGQQKPD